MGLRCAARMRARRAETRSPGRSPSRICGHVEWRRLWTWDRPRADRRGGSCARDRAQRRIMRTRPVRLSLEGAPTIYLWLCPLPRLAQEKRRREGPWNVARSQWAVGSASAGAPRARPRGRSQRGSRSCPGTPAWKGTRGPSPNGRSSVRRLTALHMWLIVVCPEWELKEARCSSIRGCLLSAGIFCGCLAAVCWGFRENGPDVYSGGD